MEIFTIIMEKLISSECCDLYWIEIIIKATTESITKKLKQMLFLTENYNSVPPQSQTILCRIICIPFFKTQYFIFPFDAFIGLNYAW